MVMLVILNRLNRLQKKKGGKKKNGRREGRKKAGKKAMHEIVKEHILLKFSKIRLRAIGEDL